MKNKRNVIKSLTVAFLLATGAWLSSCTKSSDSLSTEASVTASSESSTSSQTGETDDMASSALSTSDQPKSRAMTSSTDYRFACATLTFDSTANKVQGSVTIDFGTGCTDSKGNIRKGKIIVSWTGGRWYVAQAVHTITFNGYSINGVVFSNNDVRVVTNVSTLESPLTWNVVATHNLTWPDATTATRQVYETRQWVLTAAIADDKFIISQTAGKATAVSGTNRHGIEFTVQITTPFEYDVACSLLNKVFLPVKGTELITYDNGKLLTVDFGTGTCDNTFTITANGQTGSYSGDNSSTN
jgi:hypothetical protein